MCINLIRWWAFLRHLKVFIMWKYFLNCLKVIFSHCRKIPFCGKVYSSFDIISGLCCFLRFLGCRSRWHPSTSSHSLLRSNRGRWASRRTDCSGRTLRNHRQDCRRPGFSRPRCDLLCRSSRSSSHLVKCSTCDDVGLKKINK